MLVAFELKMTLREAYEKIDRDEFTWWLAFLKRKQEMEKKPPRSRR